MYPILCLLIHCLSYDDHQIGSYLNIHMKADITKVGVESIVTSSAFVYCICRKSRRRACYRNRLSVLQNLC